MVQSLFVRHDKSIVSSEPAVRLLPNLKSKIITSWEKIQNPQNSKKMPFPSVLILEIRNNLSVPSLHYPSCSENHSMPGSLIVINVVPV